MSSVSDFRRFYAEFIVRKARADDRRLVDAFASVPREDFVGPGPWQVFVGSYISTHTSDVRVLYQDILIGLAPERGINNGEPSLHAKCLAAVAPVDGEAVIHLGAGTGYYSAVLATLVGAGGTVLAIEREPDLVDRARDALRPYLNARAEAAPPSGSDLFPADVVYVSAGATHPLSAWLDALRVGGRLLFPLTPTNGLGLMLLVTRIDSDVYAARALMRAAFIPYIGARDEAASAALAEALERRSIDEIRSLRRGGPPDASAWCSGDGWWLSTAEALQ